MAGIITYKMFCKVTQLFEIEICLAYKISKTLAVRHKAVNSTS